LDKISHIKGFWGQIIAKFSKALISKYFGPWMWQRRGFKEMEILESRVVCGS
jgi:hypothetical protein